MGIITVFGVANGCGTQATIIALALDGRVIGETTWDASGLRALALDASQVPTAVAFGSGTTATTGRLWFLVGLLGLGLITFGRIRKAVE